MSYSVYPGLDGNGKLQRRFFRQQTDAERFLVEQNKTSLPLDEIFDRKSEIIYNLERLNGVNGSLTDVVSFYLKHGTRNQTKKLAAGLCLPPLLSLMNLPRSKLLRVITERGFAPMPAGGIPPRNKLRGIEPPRLN
jgi:hypothetical protein